MRFLPVGPEDPSVGPPTQMGVFDAGMSETHALTIPELSLVVLVGPSGSGKSTFARKHFLPTEVLSSDSCRGLVTDDENDQAATERRVRGAALHRRQAARPGRLTVIDATNVQPEARKPLVELAREYHCLPVAIVLDLPERRLPGAQPGAARPRLRPARRPQPDVAAAPVAARAAARGLPPRLRPASRRRRSRRPTIERVPLWNDRRDEHGPFDIIGDVHGCCDELEALLGQLGYERRRRGEADPGLGEPAYAHPEGRKAVFVGDLVDRGPRILDTRAARAQHGRGRLGPVRARQPRHEAAARSCAGKDVQITHGLAETLAEIDALPDEVRAPFCEELAEFLDGLVSHYVLDDGKLVVAHAGHEGRRCRGAARARCATSPCTARRPARPTSSACRCGYNWAAEYRGPAMVVYGHTPVPEPEWLNRTINIDTGCVFGGKLTALRYPEREFVSVPAARTYCEPARPFLPDGAQAPALTAQQAARRRARRRGRAGQADRLDPAARQRHDPRGERDRGAGGDEPVRRRPEVADLPAADDVAVRDERASRACWSTRPRRSPTTAARASPQVVCEEKHMGSRAVVVVCRDEAGGAASGSACRRRGRRSSTPAPAGGSSTTPALEARVPRPGARGARPPPASGTSSTPTGSASTAS